jgi:hypothetical protein
MVERATAVESCIGGSFGLCSTVQVGCTLVAGRFDGIAIFHVEFGEELLSVGCLANGDGAARIVKRARDVHPQELRQRSKVAELVMLGELGDYPVDFLLSLSADKTVINVGGDNYSFVS